MSNIKKRGFGSMTPERRKELAQKGGQAAWRKGTARHFSPEEAREAGKKGLLVRRSHKPS